MPTAGDEVFYAAWFSHCQTAFPFYDLPESAWVWERRWFLKEKEEYKALRLDGRLLDIVLPPQIPLKVVDTAPPGRGGLNSSWKEAKLETGPQIMVPLFIANGEIIRVDIAEKKYLGRETSGE